MMTTERITPNNGTPYGEKLRELYLSLTAQKEAIEAQLAELKEAAIKDAPELLIKKVALKWDYKPGIHKLPIGFFNISAAKVNQAYNSAIGGDKWANYYGLTKIETESYA